MPDPTPTNDPLNQQTPQGGSLGGEQGGGSSLTRPEGLEDAFWDATTGVKTSELVKAFNEQGQAAKAAAEAEAARKAALPQAPTAYKVQVPGLAEMAATAKVDPALIKWDEASPAMAGYRELAHKNGWTQEQFEQGLALYAQDQLANRVQMEDAFVKALEAQRDQRRTEELAKLPEAQTRITGAVTWINSVLGDSAKALVDGLSTAASIIAVEKLQKLFVDGGIKAPPAGGGLTTPPGTLSEAEYDKLSGEEKHAYAIKMRQQAPKRAA